MSAHKSNENPIPVTISTPDMFVLLGMTPCERLKEAKKVSTPKSRNVRCLRGNGEEAVVAKE